MGCIIGGATRMNDKFKGVPVEADTVVLSEEVVMVGGIEALHQRWFWDGITAESLIFRDEDVEGLSDAALEDLVWDSGFVVEDTGVTVTRERFSFSFVNYNFGES